MVKDPHEAAQEPRAFEEQNSNNKNQETFLIVSKKYKYNGMSNGLWWKIVYFCSVMHIWNTLVYKIYDI